MNLRDLKVAALTTLVLLMSWLVITFIVVIIKALVVIGLATILWAGFQLYSIIKDWLDGKVKEKA